MLLKDKVVIISGIGPGLGVELALRAAEQGANLIIGARTPEKLDQAEAQINELGLGTQVLNIPTDVTQAEQCQAMVDAGLEKFGHIDSVINSAFAPGPFGPVDSTDIQGWKDALDVNLFGCLNLCRAAIPSMKARKSGSIVNINTMVTRKPMPAQGAYAASKAALTAATQQMAMELGASGIRVNSAFMGWMWGPSVQYFVKTQSKALGVSEDKVIEGITKNIPLGKIPDDADCAKAAIFLASDYACAITGSCLDVNGGEYLGR